MERSDYARVNLNSPSSTVDGDLRKKWKIIDGKRVLVKSGVGFVNRSLISFGEGRVHGFPFGEGLSAGFPFGVGDSAGFSFGEARQTRFRQVGPRQTRFQQIAGLVP